MSGKKRLTIPDEQLALIDIGSMPKKQKKPRGRIASLEERVTRLEAEATLIGGQLERDEEDEDDD